VSPFAINGPALSPENSVMMSRTCPRCGVSQILDLKALHSPPSMEGWAWACAKCKASLEFRNGKINVAKKKRPRRK